MSALIFSFSLCFFVSLDCAECLLLFLGAAVLWV